MATLSFPIKAGAFIRGHIRRSIKQFAYENGYKLTVSEDKGLLGSLLYFELELPDEDYYRAKQTIETWAAMMGTH